MNTMTPFDVAAMLVVLAAILGYANYRFIRLPNTLGLTILGAVAALLVTAIDWFKPEIGLGEVVRGFMVEVDFSDTLMDGMLSFLLFAGALHVNLDLLMQRSKTVLAMATVGVLVSTAIIGFGFYGLSLWLELGVSLPWCLVFGALISPTDPVAVLGILKRAGVPKITEAKVAGESLFNDGVGVVVFSVLVSFALGAEGNGEAPTIAGAGGLFLQEAGGGALLGAILGWIGFLAIKSVDEHNLEVLITLAIVMGGYALAHHLHLAGPVAMAVAGLMIGNQGVQKGMSETTRQHLTSFWSLIDEILNSVLFLLIGLEAIVITLETSYIIAGVIGIPLMIAARAVATALPLAMFHGFGSFKGGTWPILVWGGLRGGISIALALSLPEGTTREVILTTTYVIVLFSVIVQGSTVGSLARRFTANEDMPVDADQDAH